jgi:hypothetical protein
MVTSMDEQTKEECQPGVGIFRRSPANDVSHSNS